MLANTGQESLEGVLAHCLQGVHALSLRTQKIAQVLGGIQRLRVAAGLVKHAGQGGAEVLLQATEKVPDEEVDSGLLTMYLNALHFPTVSSPDVFCQVLLRQELKGVTTLAVQRKGRLVQLARKRATIASQRGVQVLGAALDDGVA